MNALTISAVVIAPEADARNPDTAADLRDCHVLRDEHHLAVWGNLDRCETFREGLEFWRGSAYEERLLFLARLDGVPVGSCSVVLPLRENTAAAAGYLLEQVERSSRLGLPVDEGLLGRLESGALDRSRDYRLIEWRNACPEEFLEAYAELKSRMSADVPTAGMEADVEEWDAERVRDEEQSRARSGVESLVAAARHLDTGELAAYTVLTRRRDRPRTLNQEDTLVAGPHRGHRLGLLTKIANIRRAQAVWPGAQSVITWNASENRHMLAINISLGFKPAGFEGEWQKRLE